MIGAQGWKKRFLEGAVRFCLRAYFRLVHRVFVEGIENIPRSADKLIIVANHGSYLDGPLLWAYLPLRFKTLIRKNIAQLPILRLIFSDDYAIQVETLNSYSLKGVLNFVNAGTPVLIFPEGRRSRTGALMKIYEGAGFISYKSGAAILPIHIKNNYKVVTSRAPGRKRWFARLTVHIGSVRPAFRLDHLPVRARRKEAASRIYGYLADTRFAAMNRKATLAQEFIGLCREHRRKIALKDVSRTELSYGKALAGAFVLGGHFSRYKEKTIGLLLPNISATVLLFLGLQLCRKVPAFLNYASGTAALKHMMALADLDIIVTSREFLERVGIGADIFVGRRLVFLEDVRAEISIVDKLRAVWKSRFAGRYYGTKPDEHRETAVILFTSGSEGIPKGVPLSHENIVTNIYQCLSRIDVRENDYLLNALPMFHSFGLTVGVLLPLFAGARTYLYVSPLHYRVVPETAYVENCTILLGTNIFLSGYGKKANPYDFYTMRYIYCGAEALLDPVFQTYARKFGIRVMSGYGATECAPVLSMNNAVEYEYGTVGKILPGMEYKLVPVAGIDGNDGEAGRLCVKGGNVMRGYLKNEAANYKFLVEDEGWYDTGDIVEMTGNGFLKIIGRQKRFAKVSGEMVSLTAVEEALGGVFGEQKETALIAIPDEQRGERIILVANSPAVTLKTAREILRSKGFSEIAHPREIRYLQRLPKLGAGKVDYVQLNRMLLHENEPAAV